MEVENYFKKEMAPTVSKLSAKGDISWYSNFFFFFGLGICQLPSLAGGDWDCVNEL